MYYHHRFPSEIISYTVWLYYTFRLSYRDMQKLLRHRGIDASHETMRAWCQKFGQRFAQKLRQRRRRVTDEWHQG